MAIAGHRYRHALGIVVELSTEAGDYFTDAITNVHVETLLCRRTS